MKNEQETHTSFRDSFNSAMLPTSTNRPKVPSFGELKVVYDIVDSVIDNLPAESMLELSRGSSGDMDLVFETLLDEAASLLVSPQTVDTSRFGYIDAFSNSLEETFRCKNINYFMLSCLPDVMPSPHVLEWGNLTMIYKLLCVLAARDHGKSFFFSFIYPLWQMYRYKSKRSGCMDRDLNSIKKGMIITNEFGLGIGFLKMIKEEIEFNEELKWMIPDDRRGRWGSEQILTSNGAQLTVKSAGSKIRGHHPAWIVLDDFLNESSLYSADQRAKYWETFVGTIFPALEPGGNLKIVGTPFSQEDMYHTLKKKEDSGFKFFEYPGIYADGSLLFPQRHTYESLMQKKSLLGSLVFTREILVRPIADVAAIFPYEILNNAIKGGEHRDLVFNKDSFTKSYVKVAVGCDFAISSSIGADYSVFTILGLDELGHIDLLNCVRLKGANYAKQIGALKQINRDFEPDIFYAEDNGLQQIFIQMMEESDLPVVGKTTTAANKKSLYQGVPSLAVLFESKKIKFPYKSQRAKDVTDLYFSELNSVTFIQGTGKLESTTQHDDCAMSLWEGVRAIKGSVTNFDFSFLK